MKMFNRSEKHYHTEEEIKEMCTLLAMADKAHRQAWDLGVQRLRRVCDNKGWSVLDVFNAIWVQVTGSELVGDNITHSTLTTVTKALNNFASYNQRKVDGADYKVRVRRAVFHAVED